MITLNGKEVENPKTIKNLIKQNNFKKNICILVNGNIIKKDKWVSYKLKDNDRVELVTFVGGG